MIKKTAAVVLLFISVLFMESCSKTIYFTQGMRNELRKNYLNIDKIQFYNSKKIVLQRNLSYADTKVARGKINFVNGQYVESIIIPKKTPGVVVSQGDNYLNIAFEEGPHRFLKFVLNADKEYQISAVKWNQGYGKVKYDTLFYYITPQSSKALLKVVKNDRFNLERSSRRLKGRPITQ
jgi:hypothetical protein